MLLDPKLENPHASKPLDASHFKESDQLISMANRSKYQREKQECLLEIFHFFGVWIDFQGRNVWEFLIQPFLLIDFPQRDRKSIPTLLFFVSTASIPRGHPLPANSPKNILGAAAARASCDGSTIAIHRWDPGFGLCPDFKV